MDTVAAEGHLQAPFARSKPIDGTPVEPTLIRLMIRRTPSTSPTVA
jgi:hypothetical protein